MEVVFAPAGTIEGNCPAIRYLSVICVYFRVGGSWRYLLAFAVAAESERCLPDIVAILWRARNIFVSAAPLWKLLILSGI